MFPPRARHGLNGCCKNRSGATSRRAIATTTETTTEGASDRAELPRIEAIRRQQPGEPQPARLWREAKRQIASRAEIVPEDPKPRRRGETGGIFRTAATAIMRRAVCFPPEAYAAATAFLSDTLDWMNPYWQDDADPGEPESGFDCPPPNHLSPRL
jgi:hypothetical protein